MYRHKLYRFCLLVGGFFTIVGAVAWVASFRYTYNATPSYPLGLYTIHTIKATEDIHRGQMVIFCAPDTEIFERSNREYVSKSFVSPCKNGYQRLIKKVAALPGDYITIDDNVTINGKIWPLGELMDQDPQGHPLAKAYSKPFTVPEGSFWAMSDYLKYSFDSRYFGLVPLDHIQGEVTPLWTWDDPVVEIANKMKPKKLYKYYRIDKTDNKALTPSHPPESGQKAPPHHAASAPAVPAEASPPW